jgi:O-antigen/teichoic acid export membrane protein
MFDHLKRLARHTAVYGVGDLLGRAVNFLLVPLYARRLLEAENAVMGVAFSFIAFAGIFCSLGLNQALLRYFGKGEDERELRRTFSAAMIVTGAASAVLFAGVWAWADRIAWFLFEMDGHGRLVRMSAAILFLDTMSGVPLNALRALERPSAYAGIKLAQFTLTLVLNIVLIVYAGRGLGGAFESNLIASAFALVCCLPVILKYLRPTLSAESTKRLLAFGLPYVPTVLAGMVTEVSDRWFVIRFAGAAEAGVYTIVYKFGMVMSLATSAFRSAWLPFLVNVSRKEDGRPLCARTMTYFLMAGVMLCLAVTLFLDEIVGRLASPDYLRGKPVVPVVLAAYLFGGVYVNLMAGVYVKERTRILPAIVGAGAAVNILGNVTLIPAMGMMGAAWATLAAYVVMAGVLYVRERGFYPVAYEWGRLAKVLIAGAAVTALGRWGGFGETPWGVAGRAALLAAYPAILWAAGTFERGEVAQLKGLLGRRRRGAFYRNRGGDSGSGRDGRWGPRREG